MKLEVVHGHEISHARGLNGFPTNEGEAMILTGLPADLQGKTIVDLGARMSSLVPALLSREVDAYAIDCAYFNPIDEILKVESNTLSQRPIDNPTIDPPTEGPKKLVGISSDWSKNQSRNLIIQQAQSRICSNWAQFEQSFEEYRERYVAAWFSALPFENNSADFVVSINSLSELGGWVSLEAYEFMVRESLRITRKGGVLIMASQGYRSKDQQVADILSEYDDYEISFDSVPAPYSQVDRFKIIKRK